MTQEERFINGDLLRLRREERGWVLSDMALRSCMSVKQIRQLEEGGTSAFYSEAVKHTAAKKVAAVLGLSEHEVFEREPEVTASPLLEEPVASVAEVQPAAEPELAAEGAPAIEITPPSVPRTHAVGHPSEVAEVKPKTSLWTIVSLFFLALAVAAYLQPQEEESVEAAPPLQAVPEADTPASGAEPVASSASAPAVVEMTASAAQKPTTAALPAASGPVSVVAPVRVAASAAISASAPMSAASRTP